jgi:tetratricopeptide (TPR) repeat protein
MKKVNSKNTPKAEVPANKPFPWWPVLGGAAALVLVLIVYGPALHGPFVFDDRSAPWLSEEKAQQSLFQWIQGNRPFLMATFWVNFKTGGIDPFGYHLINVLLHYLTSVVVGLSVVKLVTFAGIRGTKSVAWGLFGGALFLLHPLQTESVAYVISRSEALSVLFYYAAFVLFLYRPEGVISWARAVSITVLMAGALSTKEHTLTLPALFLLTSFWFDRKRIRESLRLYGMMAVATVAGGAAVWAVLRSTSSAGFALKTLNPVNYALTQCRVIWTYVRLFFLPYGQNLDPDVPLSNTLLEHGAIFALLALMAGVIAAWVYRKSWPLASYGFLVFLLLLSPTSSVVPILDVMAEHRMYLPMLGLILICIDVLRRATTSQATWTAIAVLAICSVLTFQRSRVWSDPLLLWADAAEKSPNKQRPRVSVAATYHDRQQCAVAAEHFEIASKLEKPTEILLLDWALNDECLGRFEDGVKKLLQANSIRPTATLQANAAMLYGEAGKWSEALEMLAMAEKTDPRFPYTYAYRGDYFEVQGDYASAAAEYRKAIAVAPWMQKAKDGLARVTRH